MVTPCGGVTVIYRGLYEMVVGGYLFDYTTEVLVVYKLDVFILVIIRLTK